jgi:hypothetical protein
VYAVIHSETGRQGAEASGIIVSHDEQLGPGPHACKRLHRQVQALAFEFVPGEQDHWRVRVYPKVDQDSASPIPARRVETIDVDSVRYVDHPFAGYPMPVFELGEQSGSHDHQLPVPTPSVYQPVSEHEPGMQGIEEKTPVA